MAKANRKNQVAQQTAPASVAEAPVLQQERPAPEKGTPVQSTTERIHGMMLAAVQQAASVEAGLADLAKKRGAGVYSVLTLCAAADTQGFETVWNQVKTEMGADVGGCATAAGLKKSAKTGAFKIPSSASSAASTLMSAIEWGVALTDVNTGSPLAFNKVRQAVNEERAKRMEAGADDIEKVLFKARAALAVVVGQLSQLATAKLESGETRISDRIDQTMLHFIERLYDDSVGFSVAYAPPADDEVTEGADDVPEDEEGDE